MAELLTPADIVVMTISFSLLFFSAAVISGKRHFGKRSI